MGNDPRLPLAAVKALADEAPKALLDSCGRLRATAMPMGTELSMKAEKLTKKFKEINYWQKLTAGT